MRVLTLIFSPAKLSTAILSVAVLYGCGAPDIASQDISFDEANGRVVSTSLCADTYVLSTIPHANIAALSWQADDDVSIAPDALRGRPKAWDDAERLLALKPSLVVFGPGEGSAAKLLLGKAGIASVTLQWGEDFSAITANTLALASAAHISVSVKERRANLYDGARPKILYLSPSGASAGIGTYVDAAIIRAGGKNIITRKGWHTPDLETMAGLQPDLIVTSFFKDGYASINEAGMTSKILQDKLKNTPHINVPGKLWPCAGPNLYAASDIIKQGIKQNIKENIKKNIEVLK